MDLSKALKIKGRPFEIPDCSRDDLPGFFVEMGFRVGAEIGVYKGEFSAKIAKTGLKLFSVDPYFPDQEKLGRMYQDVKQLLAPYPKCKIIRKTSMEAVGDFEDRSLDFVYIDGNHEFRYIAEDLSEWTKKVRKGGIVSGDDYFYHKHGTSKDFWHVAHVLNAYIGAYGIENWYLLGRKNALPGEKRDRYRSWMFVKQ